MHKNDINALKYRILRSHVHLHHNGMHAHLILYVFVCVLLANVVMTYFTNLSRLNLVSSRWVHVFYRLNYITTKTLVLWPSFVRVASLTTSHVICSLFQHRYANKKKTISSHQVNIYWIKKPLLLFTFFKLTLQGLPMFSSLLFSFFFENWKKLIMSRFVFYFSVSLCAISIRILTHEDAKPQVTNIMNLFCVYSSSSFALLHNRYMIIRNSH